MGLFWSMTAAADPVEVAFLPRRHEMTLTASIDGEEVAETTVERRLAADGVESRSAGGDLVGTTHTPPGTGSAPGVVLLHDGFGQELRPTARLLAAHGFVALSIQYFGNPDPLPDVLSEVPVEYAQRAVERVLAHPRVDASQVGVLGHSKGAELALLLASHDRRVGAAVCTAPSSVVWEGYDLDGYPTGTSSWTIDGDPVPYLEYAAYDEVPPSADPFDRPRAFYEYSELQASPEAVEAATIPVERGNGAVQLFSGTADRLWHSTPMSNRLTSRLDRHDDAREYDHRAFEGAGHIVTLPYLPTYGLSDSSAYPLGGEPRPNARASREHWPAALSTLAGTARPSAGFEPDSPPVSPSTAERSGNAAVETGVQFSAVLGICAAVLLGIYRETGRSFTSESVATFMRSATGGGSLVVVMLAVAAGLVATGAENLAVIPLIFAFLVWNDVAMHILWSRVDDYLESRGDEQPADSGRELGPPKISQTTKTVVIVGSIQLFVLLIVGFVVLVFVE